MDQEQISVEAILKAVSEVSNISTKELQGPTFTRVISVPRALACHIIRIQRPDIALKKIGAYFNGRDHSTIHSLVNNGWDYLRYDKKFKSDYEAVMSIIKPLNES